MVHENAHTQQAQNIIKLWAICSIHIPPPSVPSHSFMTKVHGVLAHEISVMIMTLEISLGQPNFASLSAQAYTFYEPKKERQQCRERNPGSTLLHCQCN